jgi:hypothetical protein
LIHSLGRSRTDEDDVDPQKDEKENGRDVEEGFDFQENDPFESEILNQC